MYFYKNVAADAENRGDYFMANWANIIIGNGWLCSVGGVKGEKAIDVFETLHSSRSYYSGE